MRAFWFQRQTFRLLLLASLQDKPLKEKNLLQKRLEENLSFRADPFSEKKQTNWSVATRNCVSIHLINVYVNVYVKQLNLNSSNTDYSFTMANSNSVLSPNKTNI